MMAAAIAHVPASIRSENNSDENFNIYGKKYFLYCYKSRKTLRSTCTKMRNHNEDKRELSHMLSTI